MARIYASSLRRLDHGASYFLGTVAPNNRTGTNWTTRHHDLNRHHQPERSRMLWFLRDEMKIEDEPATSMGWTPADLRICQGLGAPPADTPWYPIPLEPCSLRRRWQTQHGVKKIRRNLLTEDLVWKEEMPCMWSSSYLWSQRLARPSGKSPARCWRVWRSPWWPSGWKLRDRGVSFRNSEFRNDFLLFLSVFSTLLLAYGEIIQACSRKFL